MLVWCVLLVWGAMAYELNDMLANLKFSETEQERVICQSSIKSDMQGYEALALGKFMLGGKN